MLSDTIPWASSFSGWSNAPVAILIGLVLLCLAYFSQASDDGEPPKLGETIPFLSNTIEMAANPHAFQKRVLKTMRSLNSEILRFRLGGRTTYLVMGEKLTSPLFRTSSGFTAQRFVEILTDVMFGPTKVDLGRFANDITGRVRDPVPGTEHIEDRLWVKFYKPIHEKLAHPKATRDLGRWYCDRFTARVNELFPLGKPTEMLIWNFIKQHQTDCAGRVLNGDLLFDTNSDYIKALGEYELAILPTALGPPRWLNPKPYQARDRWLDMNRRFMEKALRDYNWDTAPTDGWDPVLGSPLTRELARFGLDAGLDMQTIAGICGQQVSNQNSNSVPATAWCLMSALTCPDPDLLPNLRREAEAALLPPAGADGAGPDNMFDLAALTSSPWLQAVYAETLRLRVTLSIVRDATRDTTLGGFGIPSGAMVQAAIPLAHYNETAWGVEGHPAEEFWPRRHLQTTEKGEATFAISGSRAGYWFPYGGGPTMCPGRNFAKQEIIWTLALFLVSFDIEVVGWVMPDGKTPSDREAKNGEGFAVSRPDRELKVRVTKRR